MIQSPEVPLTVVVAIHGVRLGHGEQLDPCDLLGAETAVSDILIGLPGDHPSPHDCHMGSVRVMTCHVRHPETRRSEGALQHPVQLLQGVRALAHFSVDPFLSERADSLQLDFKLLGHVAVSLERRVDQVLGHLKLVLWDMGDQEGDVSADSWDAQTSQLWGELGAGLVDLGQTSTHLL